MKLQYLKKKRKKNNGYAKCDICIQNVSNLDIQILKVFFLIHYSIYLYFLYFLMRRHKRAIFET